MIVYTKTCLPCTHKKQWRALKQYAQENGLIIEVHRVNRNPESKLESQKYDVELPFIVNGKQVISLNEPLERLEEI